MNYTPSQPPYGLDPDLQNWVEEEFQAIAEAMSDVQESLTLVPQTVLPNKYQTGTVVLFAAGAQVEGSEILSEGLYVFRNGEWKKLVEE